MDCSNWSTNNVTVGSLWKREDGVCGIVTGCFLEETEPLVQKNMGIFEYLVIKVMVGNGGGEWYLQWNDYDESWEDNDEGMSWSLLHTTGEV